MPGCLFVNAITPEPLEISSRNFSGIILRSQGNLGKLEFENGYVPRVKTDFGRRALSSAAPQILNHRP